MFPSCFRCFMFHATTHKWFRQIDQLIIKVCTSRSINLNQVHRSRETSKTCRTLDWTGFAYPLCIQSFKKNGQYWPRNCWDALFSSLWIKWRRKWFLAELVWHTHVTRTMSISILKRNFRNLKPAHMFFWPGFHKLNFTQTMCNNSGLKLTKRLKPLCQ